MIITETMLNEKVPLEMIPSRFDSATDLYTNTDKGLILYNIKPDTWNVLYPFFQQDNKFIKDHIEIKEKDITYRELIEMFEKVYNEEYVNANGFDENKRKSVLIDEFNKTFGVNGTTISRKLNSHYELKYSKSKNVYTLYYLESYLVDYVDDVKKLLEQRVYSQELLSLDEYPVCRELNNIKIVDSISILDNKDIFDVVKDTVL